MDHRLLTSDGRKEIKEEINTAYQTVKDQVKVAGKVVTGQSSISQADDLLAGAYHREDVIKAMRNSENPEERDAVAILENPAGHLASELDAAKKVLSDNVMQKYGYTKEELKDMEFYSYNTPGSPENGFREKGAANSGDIATNIGNTGKGTEEYFETYNHEIGHAEATNSGMSASESEEFARNMGDIGNSAMDGGIWLGGGSGINYNKSKDLNGLDSGYANLGNYRAAMVPESNREDNFVAIGYQLVKQRYTDPVTGKFNWGQYAQEAPFIAAAGVGASALAAGAILVGPAVLSAGASAYTAVDAAMGRAGVAVGNAIIKETVTFGTGVGYVAQKAGEYGTAAGVSMKEDIINVGKQIPQAYTSVVNTGTNVYYNVGSKIENVKFNKIVNNDISKNVFDFGKSFVMPSSGSVPKTVGGALGSGITTIKKYGHPVVDFLEKEQNENKK